MYKDTNDFRFSDSLVINAYHELSHPYINPLGEKYFKEELNNVFKESKEKGLQSCYINSLTAINEYCVRAVSIYLVKDALSEELLNKVIDDNIRKGYPHIKELMDLFNKKNEYSSFDDVYKSEIVTFFMNLEKIENTIKR